MGDNNIRWLKYVVEGLLRIELKESRHGSN